MWVDCRKVLLIKSGFSVTSECGGPVCRLNTMSV